MYMRSDGFQLNTNNDCQTVSKKSIAAYSDEHVRLHNNTRIHVLTSKLPYLGSDRVKIFVFFSIITTIKRVYNK